MISLTADHCFHCSILYPLSIYNNKLLPPLCAVYVDRMMGVDVKNFRHEQILVFYVSWVDATAAAKVQAATARVQDPAQNYTCRRPCNNRVYGDACCDDIYIPTFVFRNAYDFPNERESNISLYDNGGVMLTEYVHGMFYQPMDYSNYPFLSFGKLFAAGLLGLFDLCP